MTDIAIKDALRELRLVQSRLSLTAGVVAALALLLVVRLFYLQVAGYERYATLSRSNRISMVPVPPVRGIIFDRNGRVLAHNFPTYTLEIVPDRVVDLEALLDELGRIIELRPADLERFRRELERRPGFERLTLRSRLSEAEAARFAVNRYRFNGVELRARLERSYPSGPLAVHVVGYVGRVSEQDLKRIDKALYRGTDTVGKLGVEAAYEHTLLGRPGYEQVETNAHGRTVRVLSRKAPVAGAHLYLTIDLDLQAVAEQALGRYRGAVVAIEPATGGVLAFASTPAYDPNLFVNGIDEAAFRKLRDSPDRPLLNRALAGRYAPGSTIKPLLALAALEYGRSPHRQTFCPGWFSLPRSRHRYRCWRRSGHGWVNLHEAIVQSCDVYFYDLAAFLGIDRIHRSLRRFGLGRPTGIDLVGEAAGLVPSAQWKMRVKGQPWYPGETVITGIGQGYLLVTPLQLAYAAAIIANRGRGMQPHVVQALEDRARGSVTKIEPRLAVEIKPRNRQAFDRIIRAMTDVVHGPQGTARRLARGLDYRMAGKTGTAQVIGVGQNERYDERRIAERLRDHSLFMAFAPVERPRIAVAVVAENAGPGSRTAAPIAKKVIDYYLSHRRARRDAGS